MTCKECIHYDVCKEDNCALTGHALVESTAEVCDNFKDKSRFVELPCNVGDTVYRVYSNVYSKRKSIEKTKVSRFSFDGEHVYVHCEFFPTVKAEFGKCVFMTREEAEAKLKEIYGKA